MTAITPVGPIIQNFGIPGVKTVISANPNLQVPDVIEPQESGVIKPQTFGAIVTFPC